MTSQFRYAIVPAAAITDPSVEPRALQVLCLLGRHVNNNGWCWRSQVKMARELGCGRSTVQRAVDSLVASGYVERRIGTRGSAAADPTRQPDSAYQYRVILDQQDVPTSGQGVPTSGQGVPTSRAPIVEHTLINESSSNEEGAFALLPCEEPKKKNFTLPSWVPLPAWEGFLEMRKRKRAVPTERAKEKLVEKLNKLREQGHDPATVLDRSTMNCWTDIYAPKEDRPFMNGAAISGPGVPFRGVVDLSKI